MIKFYTDVSQLTPENRRRVFPMLFDWFYLENSLVKEYFKYVEKIEDADICILPLDLGFYLSNVRKKEVDILFSSAKHYNKKVWVYSGGDFGTTLSGDVITFRLGGFHSKMNVNTFVMPSFVNDPYETVILQKWLPLSKKEKPTIGFVGNADGSFYKLIKEALIYSKQTLNRFLKKDITDKQVFFPSSSVRFKLLEKLRTSDKVFADFTYRNKYRAGVNNEEQKIKTTLEFYQNIERNLFTFCLRGSGNFSVRFYETLMMGRIPVLIDTDVRLPFHNNIDWHKHCLIVSSDNYIEQLVSFFEKHSNEDLIEIQKGNRRLALEELNRQNYFISITQLENTI